MKNPTDKRWLVAVLGTAFTFYVISVVGVVLLFVYYGNSCALSETFISLSMIFVVIAAVLTLFRNQIIGAEGAVLPSGVVSLYVIYLTWSAVQSNPDEKCENSSLEGTSSITVGICIMVLSLMWTTFRASQGTENLMRGDEEAPVSTVTPLGGSISYGTSDLEAQLNPPKTTETTTETTTNNETTTTETQTSSEPPENVTLFFLILVVSSLYMSMILTNWGEKTESGDVGSSSMWAKIISAWMACLLYIWTLIAPAVCRGYREFN